MSDNPKRETMSTDHPDGSKDAVVERFQPTSGRFAGIVGLATAAVVLVFAVLPWDTGTPLGVALVAAFGGLAAWAALLRPALWVTENHLVMRNMLVTFWIPLSAIDRVIIAQVLAVTADDKRYVSPVIGYTLRQSLSGRSRRATTKAPTAVDTYQIFVEERILHHSREARERGQIDTAVRRVRAWPEIVGMVGLAVAFVVWLVVH